VVLPRIAGALSSQAGVVVEVEHRRVDLEKANPPEGQQFSRTRNVRLHYREGAPSKHKITIEDTMRRYNTNTQETIVKTTVTKTKKAYTPDEWVLVEPKPYWTAPMYQLDEFVNRVRGAGPHGAWVRAADSIGQMKTIEIAYGRAGLLLPSPSLFTLSQLPDTNPFYEVPPRTYQPPLSDRNDQPRRGQKATQAQSSSQGQGHHQAQGSARDHNYASSQGHHQVHISAQGQNNAPAQNSTQAPNTAQVNGVSEDGDDAQVNEDSDDSDAPPASGHSQVQIQEQTHGPYQIQGPFRHQNPVLSQDAIPTQAEDEGLDPEAMINMAEALV
jgi:hypothetical protein